MEKRTQKLISLIKKELLQALKSQVEGILLFGSHSAGFDNKHSDLDIWIILKNYSDDQLYVLAQIHKKHRPHGLSLQPKWLDELNYSNPGYASHKGNGHFLIWELHRAKIIYGNNPFLHIPVDKKL